MIEGNANVAARVVGRRFVWPIIVVSALLVGLTGCSNQDSAASRTNLAKKRTQVVSGVNATETSTASSESTSTTVADARSGENGPSKDGGTETAPTAPTGSKKAGEARGSISQIEPAKAGAGEMAPVSFKDTISVPDGVTLKVTSVTAEQATAALPGETSGPAVRVTLDLRNGTGKPMDLDKVAVLLTPMTGVPAIRITNPTLVPLQGTAAPDSTSTGTYLFRIDPELREQATLSVKYSSDIPTAIFTGSLPNG